MHLTVSELARQIGGEVEGDGALDLSGVAGLREAKEGDVTFLSNPKYAAAVSETSATAVIVPKKWDRPCRAAVIRVDDPDASFAMAASVFAPPPVVPPAGVHPTAVVAAGAGLGADVSIGPHVVIEPGASIGDRTVIMAGCYVGHEVQIGADCKLYPLVSIRERCRIGSRVILHNGVVVGSDGFGYAVDKQGVRTKIPQVGIVALGNDVEIGANTTIDRARFGVTSIGNGVKIDNLVQIAHNVVIGDHAVIVAQVGIAGSSRIGPYAILAGQAGVAGHLEIGAGTVVGAQAGVGQDLPPKTVWQGSPAVPYKDFAKSHFNVMRIPQLKEKLAELEKRLGELEKRLS